MSRRPGAIIEPETAWPRLSPDKELLGRARYMVASLLRDSQIFKLDAKELLEQLDALLNENKP